MCYSDYDDKTRRPMMTGCGHTTCEECLLRIREMENPKCPTCRRDLGRRTSVNYAVLSILESISTKERERTEQIQTIVIPVRTLRSGNRAPDEDEMQRIQIHNTELDESRRLDQRERLSNPAQSEIREEQTVEERLLAMERRPSRMRIARGRSRSRSREREMERETTRRRQQRSFQGQTGEDSDRLMEEVNQMPGKKSMAVSRRADGTISMVRMTFFEK